MAFRFCYNLGQTGKVFTSRWPGEQFIEEREAERDRGLREGVYRLPSSQDSKELVARGHMIMPAFFVEKATRNGRTRCRLPCEAA